MYESVQIVPFSLEKGVVYVTESRGSGSIKPFGGGKKRSEGVRHAAQREFKEEANVLMPQNRFIFVSSYTQTAESDSRTKNIIKGDTFLSYWFILPIFNDENIRAGSDVANIYRYNLSQMENGLFTYNSTFEIYRKMIHPLLKLSMDFHREKNTNYGH